MAAASRRRFRLASASASTGGGGGGGGGGRAEGGGSGIAASDCTFTGYWEDAGRALWPLPPGLKASHYRRPGRGALLYVSNFLPTRAAVPIRVDWAALGSERGTLVDAETGQEIREQDLAVESHDLRVVLLRPAGR
jgi:hypothetical protein